MKILSAEIALREETRGVEQAKAQMDTEKFNRAADSLSITQEELAERTTIVIEKIYDLPDGEQNFLVVLKQELLRVAI